MKLLPLLSAAFGAPFNECPGTCWTAINGVCYPDLDKISIQCNAGRVDVRAESCLFLNDNVDFTKNQAYDVSFNGNNHKLSSCTQSLKKHEDSFSGSWTFEELESCGWHWSSNDDDLTLWNTLKVSNAPHLITHAGTTIEIGTGMKEIPLSCEFSRTLTLSQGFHTAQTALGQDGTTSGTNVFSPVFTINLNEFNKTSHAYYKTDGVTVGEPLQVDIDLSVPGLGYSSVGTSRIGFFAEKCGVTDSATGSQKFYLVGSGDDTIGDNCLLPRSSVDITQKMNYENEQFWSKTQLDLEFDVFRFPGTGSLRAFCQLKMCLDHECPQDATPTC